VTAATPGRAAYEVWAGTAADWNGRLNTFQQAGWETIAQAVIDVFLAGDSVSAESIREALAAQEPQRAPELAKLRERLDAIRKLCEARIRVVGMVDGKGVARKVIAIIDKPEGK
jgi:hypothetical protein